MLMNSNHNNRTGPQMYNQYDLVQINIFDEILSARPIEFDSVPIKDNINAFGSYVKPTKLATTCPRCGAYVICEVNLPDPPFDIIKINCNECNPIIVNKKIIKPQQSTPKPQPEMLKDRINLSNISKVIDNVVKCHSDQFKRVYKKPPMTTIPLTDLDIGPEEDLSDLQ